ncbi:MAG TPA: YggS family pyridoxal phosphate-dependent enzyme [Thermodesulfovibrionales bacterium]|nr:YggS family pyridoxal phosphate-dependent enzyme [Thermodesulfovibrionales bacterium]
MSLLLENISNVFKRVSSAAMRSGRSPEEVKLIAVTKTVEVIRIREAIDAGLRIFGENRVQEFQKKMTGDVLRPLSEKVEWHLIGHLQRNKAKFAVRLFDLVHSVDSCELAKELNSCAEKIGKVQEALVEVKLSHEQSKHGIMKNELIELLKDVVEMRNLNVRGLMTVPPFAENPEKARPYFRELRVLRDEAALKGFSLPELSMGMSNDFEVAIEEGATMVRIGRAIFGERE